MTVKQRRTKIKKSIQNKQKEKIKPLQKQSVAEDLTKIGYTLKAGLKYGSDFRIYAKGVEIKQGKKKQNEHSFAILDIVKSKDSIKIKNIVAKARIATTSKMQWLVAVDKSNKFLQIDWIG